MDEPFEIIFFISFSIEAKSSGDMAFLNSKS